ncbi:MAG: response regulator [Oligoflexia bacterium]|nr:response regulator [Oligoflexia bacterium]
MKYDILIVDDEKEIRDIISSFISEHMNCNIVTAVDGQDALKIALSKEFDLIITDHRMPILTGAQFFIKMRETPGPNKYSPVIFLSAFIDEAKIGTECLEDVYFMDKVNYVNKLIPYVTMILGQ